MARQTGIIKVKGKIGGMSFYKTQDGDLVREKGGVEGSRIATDPAFARTRENGAEFGTSASAGKLLRDAIRPMLQSAADNRVTSRVTKAMTDIKNLDTTSARGQRTVAVGLSTTAGKAILKGFNFNEKAVLGAVLRKPFTVNPADGSVTIQHLSPAADIVCPTGATHVELMTAWARINFASGNYSVEYSNPTLISINAPAADVTVAPGQAPAAVAAVPPGAGGGGPITAVNLNFLVILFFQDVNGIKYPLNNGSSNPLALVAIS